MTSSQSLLRKHKIVIEITFNEPCTERDAKYDVQRALNNTGLEGYKLKTYRRVLMNDNTIRTLRTKWARDISALMNENRRLRYELTKALAC